MKWNKEILNEVRGVIENSQTMSEVSDKLANMGYDVTPNAIRKAFARHDLQAPSNYLMSDEISEDSDMECDGGYIFNHNGYEIQLTEEQLQKSMVWYAAKKVGGMGMTSMEVTAKMISLGWLPPCVPQNYYLKIARVIAQYKSSIPVTPAGLDDPLEAIATRRALFEAESVSEDYYKSEIRHLRNLVRLLKKKIHAEMPVVELLESLDPSRGSGVKLEWESKTYDVDEPSAMIIPFNDLHVGSEHYDMPLSRHYPDYDEDVAKARVERAAFIVRHQIEHAGANLQELVVAFLGDAFESILGNMRDGQIGEMESIGVEQFTRLVDLVFLFCAILDDLPIESKRLIVQGGNHDRLTRSREGDTEKVLAAILTVHLGYVFKAHGMNWDIVFAGPTASVDVCGVNLITKHGHVGGLSSLSEGGIAKIIEAHGIPTKHNRQIYLQAHFHRYEALQAYNCLAITAPAWCGNTNYNIHSLNKTSQAGFIMIVVTPKYDYAIGPIRF